ncbi:hypothetical protein LCGC14_1516880 [marine sediment metagenome]|uniref:Uncharacterized protein n=1 Tax=marine sediment metagenome TaxID=412755 RepID=A0A0F9LFG8_9ZZZZ
MAVNKCPVCAGKGKMHWTFYPDAPEPTTAAETSWVTCRSCYGSGVIRDEQASQKDGSPFRIDYLENTSGPTGIIP